MFPDTIDHGNPRAHFVQKTKISKEKYPDARETNLNRNQVATGKMAGSLKLLAKQNSARAIRFLLLRLRAQRSGSIQVVGEPPLSQRRDQGRAGKGRVAKVSRLTWAYREQAALGTV